MVEVKLPLPPDVHLCPILALASLVLFDLYVKQASFRGSSLCVCFVRPYRPDEGEPGSGHPESSDVEHARHTALSQRSHLIGGTGTEQVGIVNKPLWWWRW